MYEPWTNASPNELSNALEGMEKLIMNRLYSKTFAPAALAGLPSNENYIPGSSIRVPEEAREKLGDLLDDIERDRVLAERIEIFDWVGPKELDIPEGMVENGEKFLGLAEQGIHIWTTLTLELLKINNYRAPRDKVICILNSSKVLFGMYLGFLLMTGLIRQSHLTNKDTSADSFLPLLILLLLRSNPPHLYSNIQYIQRFRHPDRLGGEGGYYLNSLEAAVGWIDSIEKGVLSCSEEDFDRYLILGT
jgi:Rab5 GDP/GTP exchange factor